MARHRIGPYIEQLRFEDDKGRFRETYWHYFPGNLVTQVLAKLHLTSLQRDFDPSEDPFGRPVGGLLEEIEGVVRGDPMPSDRILHDWIIHTDMEFLRQNHMNWMPRYRHRILVDTHITSAGNLSVRFLTKCLGQSGRWVDAPEWRPILWFGHSDIMQRPNDEVLFIRGVENLFADRIEHRRRYFGQEIPEDADWTAAACKAVNMAFWLMVYRLSARFEVHLGRYVTMLKSERYKDDCLGLDIVDALEDHRAEIKNALAAFRRATGHTPEDFWETCEEGRRGMSSSAVSKRLRGHSGPSSGLTPSVVERHWNLLQTAAKYGVWTPPPRPEPQAKPAPLARASEAGRCELMADFAAIAHDIIEHADHSGRKVFGLFEDDEAGSAKAKGTVALDPFDPPSYDGLRQAAVPVSIQVEFGIGTARGLVDRLNELWRKQERLPIPQGSFPTNGPKLKYVIQELRKAMA